MQTSFILSDETINERGYRILTSGIDLERFQKNPIMLWMHRRDDGYDFSQVLPIGKWDNVRVEDGKLMADPVFDQKDNFAKLIQYKVEQGIVKGASIGIRTVEISDDPKFIEKGQTRSTVTKCELYEASIVDIPANKNTVQLFSDGASNEIPLLINNEMADKKDEKQITFKNEADLMTFMSEKFGLEPKAENTKTKNPPKEDELKFKNESSLLTWIKEKFGLQPKAKQTETEEDLTSEEDETENSEELDETEDETTEENAADPKDQEIAELKGQVEILKKAPGAQNKKAVTKTDSKQGASNSFEVYSTARKMFDTVSNLVE